MTINLKTHELQWIWICTLINFHDYELSNKFQWFWKKYMSCMTMNPKRSWLIHKAHKTCMNLESLYFWSVWAVGREGIFGPVLLKSTKFIFCFRKWNWIFTILHFKTKNKNQHCTKIFTGTFFVFITGISLFNRHLLYFFTDGKNFTRTNTGYLVVSNQ